MRKNINLLYELKTPIGYLGMGYDVKSIPYIFEYINGKENSNTNTIRYSSFGKYRKLIDGSDISHKLNSFLCNIKNKNQTKQMLYSELTEDNLKFDINFFNIPTLADETIVEYIENVDFDSLFLPQTLKFIKNNPNIKILFSDEREGSYVYSEKFFSKFYNFYKKNKLNTKQIYFFTNTANISEQYNLFIKRNKMKSFMNIEFIPFLVMPESGFSIVECENNKFKTIFKNETYTIPSIEEIEKKRKYHYLCLNRNSERRHRPQLVLELIKNDIFQKGKVSLLKSKGLEEYSKSNLDYQKLIVEKYPFVIDEEDANKVAGMHGYLTKKKMWLDTYFSVVSETSVLNNTVFITEKTIRPMIYYHPFIVWGNPKTLYYLKKLGFETFPEFFDEDYDNIIDNDKRLEHIVNNLNRLCEMDLSEIHDLYQKVKPKLIHNYNLLKNFYNDGSLYELITTKLENEKTII
jgi:hypothetical protein